MIAHYLNVPHSNVPAVYPVIISKHHLQQPSLSHDPQSKSNLRQDEIKILVGIELNGFS